MQKRTFDVLIAIYKQLYEQIHDSTNLYEMPDTILTKTPDELAQMLI